MRVCDFFLYCYGDHLDLHGLTHSFPTRRSSDLEQLREDALGFFRADDLPDSLAWVDALSPRHQRLFVVELADAIKESALTGRSEEHTSELQSLMRISYAVFCLNKKH